MPAPAPPGRPSRAPARARGARPAAGLLQARRQARQPRHVGQERRQRELRAHVDRFGRAFRGPARIAGSRQPGRGVQAERRARRAVGARRGAGQLGIAGLQGALKLRAGVHGPALEAQRNAARTGGQRHPQRPRGARTARESVASVSARLGAAPGALSRKRVAECSMNASRAPGASRDRRQLDLAAADGRPAAERPPDELRGRAGLGGMVPGAAARHRQREHGGRERRQSATGAGRTVSGGHALTPQPAVTAPDGAAAGGRAYHGARARQADRRAAARVAAGGRVAAGSGLGKAGRRSVPAGLLAAGWRRSAHPSPRAQPRARRHAHGRP